MMAYSIVWHERAAAIPATLWAQCFPPPFEGWWWYDALERCGIADQFRFFYAVVHATDGTACAIAPLFSMDMPLEMFVPEPLLPTIRLAGKLMPSLLHQRTLFVGSPCSDQGRVGMLPGVDRPAILTAVHTAMELKARAIGATMLTWKDFPADCDAEMQRLAEQAGLFVVPSFPGTSVALPPGGKAAYLAALKGSRRHQLKKKLRLSAAAVEIEIEIVQDPDTTLLDHLFDLFWQTYEKATTRFERLNRTFFTLIAAIDQSHFVVLRQHGDPAPIAFMLCFDMGDRVINKFIGIDYHRPREWLLYFRLWEAALDWSYTRGAQAIESGQTGYSAKLTMGHELLPLSNYCRHRNPLMHWVYARVARRINWATLDSELAERMSPADVAQA